MGQSEYISWVKCTSWLSNFVNLRGLRQPDGRPLYEYHATNDEYTQLTQLLRAVGQSQSKEGANKRGNSSRLTQSFHFFMFEPIFSPVNALNQPI